MLNTHNRQKRMSASAWKIGQEGGFTFLLKLMSYPLIYLGDIGPFVMYLRDIDFNE